MDRSEHPLGPRHLGVPLGASKIISEPMVRLAQTDQLSCIKISTISKWTALPLEPRHQVVPSGASKTTFDPVVRLSQTMHLSCTDTKNISKQSETRFHMTHVA
jgi:hypothetical protein